MKVLGYVAALFGVSVVGVSVVAWLACERYHAHISNPTARASTYSEYRAKLPAPVDAEVLRTDGTQYYAAIGPVKPPLVRASGPPMYIFDDSGRMIDWTLDRYDDSRFQQRWERAEAQKISIAQLDATLHGHQ